MVLDPSHNILLTVAVICRNEERNIDRCLRSIVTATGRLAREILVVDSASTDRTIELAGAFPVRIIRLKPDWPLSPAAGRYTAVLQARGRYLLIIDGDMELLPGFVEAALEQMELAPRFVAVRGRLHNYHLLGDEPHYVNSMLADHIGVIAGDVSAATEVPTATGAGLFRRQAILAAGNFHPFLKAEEEYELCRRLRVRGDKILYLPIDAVNHYGYEQDPLAEVFRRLRRGLIGGAGQLARIAFAEGYGLRNLLSFRVYLVEAVICGLTPAILLLGWQFPPLLLSWLLLTGTLLGGYLVKKKHLKAALAALLLNVLIGFEIVRGLFVKVPDRNSYPHDVQILDESGSRP